MGGFRRSAVLVTLVCTVALLLPAVASADYAATVLADNPRVYLPLDERSGTTFANLGSDGGTAELLGPPGAEVGVYGAIESDEPSDRAVRLNHRQALEIRPRAGSRLDGSYTLEAWTKLEAYVFHEWGPNYAHLFSGTPRLWFEERLTAYQDIGGFAWGQAYWGTISLREWHHVALTWRPSTPEGSYGEIHLYVDGVHHGGHATSHSQLTVYSDALRLAAGANLQGWVDEIAAYDYELSPERIAEHHTRGRSGFGSPPPANTTPPSAVGEAVVGKTARCDEGVWTGGPRTFSFRWLRDGQPIDRAIKQRYVLSADDVNHDVTCEVVAHNVAGSSAPLTSTTTISMTGATPTDYRGTVLADNPRVYLPLDERSGSTFASLGADGGGADLYGPVADAQVGTYGAIESDEPSDRALRLSGRHALEIKPRAGSRLDGDYTIEGWTKLETHVFHEWGPNWAHLFGGTSRLWFEGHLTAFQDNGAFAWGQALWGGALPLNAWHHVVMTWTPYTRDDGYGETNLYIDGVHHGGRATSRGEMTLYSDALRLTAGNNTIGWVDEVAVYDYPLTPERIAEHHRRGAEGFGAPAPTNRTLPRPVGTPVVGKSARCDEGVWTGGPRTFSFRWLRDGAPIDRATKQRYVLTADDLNHEIRCEVVAHNRAGASDAVIGTDRIAMPSAPSPASYGEMVLQENPRIYLPLDERSGTTFASLGTDGGDALLLGPVQDAEIGAYGALESDVATDRSIRMSGRHALEFRPRSGTRLDAEYTIEGWTKLETHVFHEWGPNYAHLFGGTSRLWFEGHMTAHQDQGGFAWGGSLWGGGLTLREWRHVAMTWRPYTRDDGYGEVNLYVDGVHQGGRAAGRAEMTLYSDALQLYAGSNTIGWIDELAVYDYELTPERIAKHYEGGHDGFGAPAPTNVTRPDVTGDPVVGKAATCDEGTWRGGPRTFSFRWLRDGDPIPGATERTYTLSGDDLGHAITCAVIATNAAGSSTEVVSTGAITLPPVTIGRYRDVVMADNPVVYLPFTDVTDRRVTPNLGSHGGTALNPYTDVRTVGGALNGDSDPGLAVDAHWLELHPKPGSRVAGDYTVEGWIWMVFPSGGTLFGGWAQTAFYPHFTRLLSDTGILGTRLSSQEWHHVALTTRGQTRDRGGQVDLYVDGLLQGSLAAGNTLLYDDANRLGMAMSIPGAVDELAVYDYRLSPERIGEHHRSGRDGVEPPYPLPLTPPHVSGEGRVGAELTCDPATWTGSPTSFEYRWTRDGAVIAGANASTYTAVAADGDTTVACAMRATNASGTSGWAPSDNGVYVPPVPRNLVPPAVTGKPWPGERVTCAIGEWADGEDHEVRWQLDGPDVAGLPGDQYDISGPEGGRLRCLVQMTGPGGTSDWVPSETVVIDGTPPTVDLVCPTGHVAPGQPATASFTASDAHSGLVTPPAGTIDLDTSAPGTHTASTTARDAAGRATTATCTYRVLHSAPGAPEAADDVSDDGLVALTWPGSPDASGYELQVRRAGELTWTDVAATTARGYDYTTALAEGTWFFRVRAVDADFDDAWSPVSAPVVVDRTAPTIDLTCPTATLSIGEPAQATFTASDTGSGLVTPGSGSVALDTSAAGTHTASTTARDAAGHATTATCAYRVAYGGPGAPELSGGHTSPTDDGAIQLTWPSQGAPDAARYVLEKHDADDAPGTWTTVATVTSRTHDFTTPLTEGTWTFRVRADDPAFESTWSPDSTPVKVDLSPPAARVVIASPNPQVLIGAERWYKGSATLTVDASDPVLADGSAGSGLVASSVPAPVERSTTGALTLGAPAVADAAGNTRAVPAETVRVDADAPRVTVTCPTGLVARGSNATATWAADDGTGESGLATASDGTLTLDTSVPGAHTSSTVVSRDRVGNETSASCSYRVAFPDVDWEKPLNEKKPVEVTAGATAPLSFAFKGRPTTYGTAILVGRPAVTEVGCANGNPKTIAPVTDPANELTLAGSVYTWTLPVDATWAGSCRQVEFTLTDGTKHAVVLIVR